VHPPSYFWSVAAWRDVFGSGSFRTGLLSVLFSLIALAGVAQLTILAGAPPVASVLLILDCYGFTYTGSITRGFALAQLCMIWGMVLILLATRERRSLRTIAIAYAAGLLLGLASFSNYLAAFADAAGVLWLLLTHGRQWRQWLAAGLGFATILPLDLAFFLAQCGSRVGQFPPFRLLPSLIRLCKCTSANVFGGLPLYLGPILGLILGAILVLTLAGLFVAIALRWGRIVTRELRRLLLMAALAAPVGLLLLGFAYTPIELRYIAFSRPFLAMLLAATFASLPRRAGIVMAGALLRVQAVSLAGLMTRQETMQPQAQAARVARQPATDGSLVLVPYGDDGVGVPGAFVSESPDGLRIRHIDPGQNATAIRAAASSATRVVLVLLGLDAASRAVVGVMQAAFDNDPCWSAAGAGFDVIAFDHRAACSEP
jgi:4-amino-4-deoxy-L-arabinose transferase-like glycosyltransferase